MSRWDPLRDLLSIKERVNRLFEDTMTTVGGGHDLVSPGLWSPVVDIYETENEFIVEAEVPDVKQTDIDIRVDDNTLVLEGERKPQRAVMEGYHRIERAYGRFQRSFLLPRSVDREHIKASLKDGVLKIILSKREETAARQIEITES